MFNFAQVFRRFLAFIVPRRFARHRAPYQTLHRFPRVDFSLSADVDFKYPATYDGHIWGLLDCHKDKDDDDDDEIPPLE
ncbi:hypothetical protein B0H13DRAFT_2654014 [Mycena leptocephala]|nr:hypothetical protein B0H13DRAFT_2654014 [Mycena leptocephala]